jgi:hypothetical protein
MKTQISPIESLENQDPRELEMSSDFVSASPREAELKQTLLKICNIITSTPIEQLTMVAKYGRDGGFGSLEPWFVRTKLFFQKLSAANLDIASETKLETLVRMGNKIQNEFNAITALSSPPNLANRDSRIHSYKETYEEVSDEIGRFLALSVLFSGTRDEEPQKLAAQLQAILDSAGKEIPETLKKARDVAEQVGIAQYASLFQKEANEHKRIAWGWLIGAILLFAATGLLAYLNYSKTLDALISITSAAVPATQTSSSSQTAPPATGLTIQLTIAKLIVFSLLFSAVLWASRIYRSHRHNYVINKHRQNALSTFEVFVKAASADEQTKNAVLLQATQCIFSAQNTGYLGSPDKDSEGGPQILEIWRSLSPKT